MPWPSLPATQNMNVAQNWGSATPTLGGRDAKNAVEGSWGVAVMAGLYRTATASLARVPRVSATTSPDWRWAAQPRSARAISARPAGHRQAFQARPRGPSAHSRRLFSNAEPKACLQGTWTTRSSASPNLRFGPADRISPDPPSEANAYWRPQGCARNSILPRHSGPCFRKLRFGVDQLAPLRKFRSGCQPKARCELHLSLQSGSEPLPEPNSTSGLPHEIPLLGVAGCTGLEPVASGVTGSEEGVAETGSPSEPLGTTGNRPAANSQLLSPLARVWTPRVTPELQPARARPYRSRLLSVREVASRLGVCASTVYKLCAEGKLRHVRVSNAIRISEAALRSYE